MLSSANTVQAAAPETSYFGQASNFALSCAKAPFKLAGWCATSTPVKASCIALTQVIASAILKVTIDANKWDFSVDNRWGDMAEPVLSAIVIDPVDKITDFCQKIFSYEVVCAREQLPISEVFYHAALEEIYFREMIQCQILPRVAKLLPETAGNILGHPITRVALSSTFFAAAHVSSWTSPHSVTYQFMGGLLKGTLRELSGITLPIYVHTLYNLSFYSARAGCWGA